MKDKQIFCIKILLLFVIISHLTFEISAQCASTNGIPKCLVKGQFYPNQTEKSASGEALYQSDGSDLVEVTKFTLENDVIIKGEEGDLSDAKMTIKAKNKIIQLAKLVQNEWDSSVYLRITEAWDTNNEHSNYALHYEGRAIDITTSDKDQKKYDRLAGLAIQVGFDWVFHEGNHIHVSVKK